MITGPNLMTNDCPFCGHVFEGRGEEGEWWEPLDAAAYDAHMRRCAGTPTPTGEAYREQMRDAGRGRLLR